MRSLYRLLALSFGTMIFLGGPANTEAGTITIDAVNDAFEVDFTGTSSSNGYPVSAETDWLTTAFTNTSITFQVTVLNTSPNPPTTSAELTGFGFNTDPNATGGLSTSLLFTNVSVTDNSSFEFDVCLENGGSDLNNCESNSGNPNVSLGVGESETFFLTLFFLSTDGGVVLSDFGARFQGINPNDSAKIFADPRCIYGCEPDIPPDTPVVPEPTTLLLVGSGIAVACRRRFPRAG